MIGWVYILRGLRTGRFYIGSTSDLGRRLAQHQQGQTATTKRLGEFELVFEQEFSSLAEARAAERRLKRWKRRDFIEKIICDGKIKT